MSNSKTNFLLLLFAFLFLPIYTQAVGIAVYPDKLFFEIQESSKETSLASIQVSNPAAETAVFQAYLEEYPNTLSINPKIFTLGPGGQTTINTAPIAPELRKAGNPKQLILNIISTDLKNNPVLISAGYKMAITLDYKNTTNKTLNLSSDKFLTGLLALSLLIIAKLLTKK